MTDVLITEDLDAPSVRRLAERFKVERQVALWNEASLPEKIAGARAVMIRNQTKMTRAIIESASNLLAIGRVGVGLDNIDVAAATQAGVVVIAPLDANAVSVAELTTGLLVALARKIPMADRSTKAGGWDRKRCTGTELAGKTLALIGFGRIGKLVAARAYAFGMRVVVFDPFVKEDAAGVLVMSDLHAALAKADFVSVHAPLTAQTRGLIDAKAIASMKDGAFLLNTARGGIVDEAALADALTSGKISGAALDVREVEPPVGENVFAAMENVILTPHIASFTVEAQTRTFEAVCADLESILNGEAATHFINFPRPRK
jgi:D-3-phosphoglycerate dehydrogenase / 2-oxoglutarate reductase